MTTAASITRHFTPGLLASCALTLVSSTVWSADTPASAALKTLLGPQAAFQQMGNLPVTMAHSAGGTGHAQTSAVPSTAAAPSLVGGTVTVQRGETLDRVIRRALPGVPLHPDFLRKAFVSLNPQVFPSGSTNQMKSGASLHVPSLSALRQMMLSQYPGAAPLLHGAEPEKESKTAVDANDQRRWVRYP